MAQIDLAEMGSNNSGWLLPQTYITVYDRHVCNNINSCSLL